MDKGVEGIFPCSSLEAIGELWIQEGKPPMGPRYRLGRVVGGGVEAKEVRQEAYRSKTSISE